MSRSGGGPTGVAVVDKPPGWTSHDVVAKARKLVGTRKIGHAGTLDPDATGVLVLGVGRATRLLRFVTALPKSYWAEVVLGVETTTLDAAGEVTARHDMSGVGLADVRAAAESFVGRIDQVPPMVSALKVGGQRLHELARRGEEVERSAREVVVHELEVSPTSEPQVFSLRVTCSSGTYVRVLGADLGRVLGGGAHIRSLRRLSVGSLGLDEAIDLERAVGLGDLPLMAPAEALRDYPQVRVEDAVARDISRGKVLPAESLGASGAGPWVVLGGTGEMLAMYETYTEGLVKPAVVLTGPG